MIKILDKWKENETTRTISEDKNWIGDRNEADCYKVMWKMNIYLGETYKRGRREKDRRWGRRIRGVMKRRAVLGDKEVQWTEKRKWKGVLGQSVRSKRKIIGRNVALGSGVKFGEEEVPRKKR